MRLNRGTLTLLVVAVVIIVVGLIISSGQDPEAALTAGTPTAVAPVRVFPDVDPETIVRFQITNNEDQSYILMRRAEAGLWVVAEGTNIIDGESQADMIVGTRDVFINLESSNGFTADDVENFDLAAFGLDEPAYTIVATAADGTEYTLYLGNQNPSGNRYYALVNDNTTDIYLVLSFYIDNMVDMITEPPYVPGTEVTAEATVDAEATGEPEGTAEPEGTSEPEGTAEPEGTGEPAAAEATDAPDMDATDEPMVEETEAPDVDEPVAEETEAADMDATEEPMAEATEAPDMDATDEPMAEATDEAEVGTILEVAEADGRFGVLISAVEAAELTETLSGEGPFTVFAPTDEAFEALPEGVLDGLLEDVPALTDILLYHVADGVIAAEDFEDMESVTTVQGADITIEVTEDGILLNGEVLLDVTAVEASNGVIYVIDTVLTPPPTAEATETSD